MAATSALVAGTASERRPKLGAQSRRRRSWLAVTLGLATILATGAVSAVTAPPSSAATPGIITTVAGGDAPGPLPATSVAVGSPGGVAVLGGNIYVSDFQSSAVREVATSGGSETVVAGNGAQGSLGDGGLATLAELNSPQGVAVDSAGDVLIADTGNNAVRIVAANNGNLYTVAGTGAGGYTGDDGPSTSAELNGPYGVTVDSAGNIIIADTGNNAIRVVANNTGTYYGVAMTTVGDIYTVAGGNGAADTGDGGPATAAQLDYPEGVAVDSAGNLVIADTSNNAVRVVAATTGTFYGQDMTAGDIYTIAGGNSTPGYSGNGGPALDAQLSSPQSVALDSGDIIIADTGNNAVRLLATEPTGGLTVGDIYLIAGDGTAGYSGDAGPATAAELSGPEAAAVDSSGNIVIADSNNNRVRVVASSTGTFYGIPMTAGDIYTVAGNGTPAYSGDGGPATSAQMRFPSSVAVDRSGNYIVAETYDGVIRVVANSTGTFYGIPMTAGDVYTVAGNDTQSYSGDGGPGPRPRSTFPSAPLRTNPATSSSLTPGTTGSAWSPAAPGRSTGRPW